MPREYTWSPHGHHYGRRGRIVLLNNLNLIGDLSRQIFIPLLPKPPGLAQPKSFPLRPNPALTVHDHSPLPIFIANKCHLYRWTIPMHSSNADSGPICQPRLMGKDAVFVHGMELGLGNDYVRKID